jgi:short-subunit dehydrogenase
MVFNQNHHNWNGKVALITGSSSGIGAVTVRYLAEKGLKVILVARRHLRLKDIVDQIESNHGSSDFIVADLRNQDERLKIFHKICTDYGNLDVLVNNAGFG